MATTRRGLCAASRMIRWKSSLAISWSSCVAERLEPLDVGARDPRGRERRGVRLDQRADVVEVAQVVAIEGLDHRAAVGLDLDQAVRLELQQRLADRRPARAEPLRERLRPQPLTGLELALEDGLLQQIAHPRLRHLAYETTFAPRSRNPDFGRIACNQRRVRLRGGDQGSCSSAGRRRLRPARGPAAGRSSPGRSSSTCATGPRPRAAARVRASGFADGATGDAAAASRRRRRANENRGRAAAASEDQRRCSQSGDCHPPTGRGWSA